MYGVVEGLFYDMVRPPTSSYLVSASVSIALQLYFGLPSTVLFFSKHVSSLKAKFFPRLKALRCSLLPHGAPLRSPSLFCIKFFFSPFSLMFDPDGCLSKALPISLNYNASTERPVAPSSAASCPPLSHFYSSRLLHLPYESP